MDRARGHGTAKIFGCTKSLDIDVHSREHVLVGIWYCCIRRLVVLVLIILTADFMLDPSPKSATLQSSISPVDSDHVKSITFRSLSGVFFGCARFFWNSDLIHFIA